MSQQAETFIQGWMAKRGIPQACERRRVLCALAGAHRIGPLRIETMAVAKLTSLERHTLWCVLFDLHLRVAFQAGNIGGLMTIVFPFDFPKDHPDYVCVPEDVQEAAE